MGRDKNDYKVKVTLKERNNGTDYDDEDQPIRAEHLGCKYLGGLTLFSNDVTFLVK